MPAILPLASVFASPNACRPSESISLTFTGMKPRDYCRRENLKALVALHGQAGLAELIGKDRNQVYQWTRDKGTPGQRNIGSRAAAAIERALNLPHGWLDTDPALNHAPDGRQSGDEWATPSHLQRPDPAMLVEAERWALIFQTAEGVRYSDLRRMERVSEVYSRMAANGGRLSEQDHAAYLSQLDGLVSKRRSGDERGHRGRQGGSVSGGEQAR